MAEARARILIVDDDASTAESMRTELRHEGYAVWTAISAPDARLLFDQERIDVALLDLRIGDSDGVDLMQHLRDVQPESVPVMLTGYASLDSAVRAIRQGAYDYLVKPYDLDELKTTVARAVERGGLVRALNRRFHELETANTTVRTLVEDLQGRVDRATADLSAKVVELSEAKERLEEEQRQRERFISMVAHELAQPLTTISTAAQLLGRDRMPPDAKERSRVTILSETRRLTRLVQDLLDATRLAAGRFQVHLGACDLGEIVRDRVELARSASPTHRIELDADAGPLPFRCDRDRIAQVLSNVITNAIKYTVGGTVHVRVGIEAADAVIHVSDEGPGIPPGRLEAVFEPNVRLVGTSGSVKGSGLGLYIARGIVEAHGGRIWAENAEGGGAVFSFSLPLQTSQSQDGAEG